MNMKILLLITALQTGYVQTAKVDSRPEGRGGVGSSVRDMKVKPNATMPSLATTILPEFRQFATTSNPLQFTLISRRTPAVKITSTTARSFTKGFGLPIFDDITLSTTIKPGKKSIKKPALSRGNFPNVNGMQPSIVPALAVDESIPALPVDERIPARPMEGLPNFENRTLNASTRVTGLCGHPPYNSKDACRKLIFFSDPLSKCENAIGKIFFGILIGFVAAAIIFVNSLIPIVVVKNSGMRTNYDFIKVSLAIADGIIGVLIFTTVIPNMVWIRNLSEGEVVEFSRNDTNSATAIVVGSFLTVTMQASLLHLCFMSIERFMAIKWSFWTIRRKTRSVVITLLAIWIVSVIAAFMPAFFPQNFEYKFQPALLIHVLTLKSRNSKNEIGYEGMIYAIFTLLLPYVITVAVCVSTGIVSYRKLRATAQLFRKERIGISPTHASTTPARTAKNDKAKNLQPEITVFITIIIMICAFTLTLMPFAIVVALFTTGVLNCGNYTIPYVTSFYSGLLNSLANGIIYSVRDARFRKAVKRLFCKDSPKSPRIISSDSHSSRI